MQKVRNFASGFKSKYIFNFKSSKKMKKLVFMFAAIVAVSFASCGGSTTAEVADSTACDSACCDTTVCCDSACADTVVAE